MEQRTSPSWVKFILIGGDLVCFAVFAVVGLRSHEDGLSAFSLLRVAVPFQAAWLVFATLLGLYMTPVARPREAWRRTLEAWLPAWLAGMLVRTFVSDRSFAPAFAVIALLFNGALLAGWRTALGLLLQRARSEDTQASSRISPPST
jgi:hypothetical protein